MTSTIIGFLGGVAFTLLIWAGQAFDNRRRVLNDTAQPRNNRLQDHADGLGARTHGRHT